MGEFLDSKLVPLVTIHPWSLESIGIAITSAGGIVFMSTSSAVYPSANLAILIPFILAKQFTVVKMFTCNGSTASGNLDVGIYTNEGGASPVLRLIVSKGSTAQSGTSVVQGLDIADTILPPGSYYMAIVMNNILGTFFRGTVTTASIATAIGIRFKTSAFPLPATITSPNDAQTTYIPVFGLTGRTVI